MSAICKQAHVHRKSFMRGFTLVELLVASSILAIGIVAVIRSFLGAVSALDSLNNRFAALQYLESRVIVCELAQRDGVAESLEDGEIPIDLRGRKAVFKTEVRAWEDASSSDGFNKLAMSVIWQESGIIKDETIVLLLPAKT